MRISTLTFATSSLSAMQSQQASIARLNAQIASGQKYLAPKDDPGAVNRALELGNRIDVRKQYLANQLKADLSLQYEGTVLEEMRKVLNQALTTLGSTGPSQDASVRRQQSDLITASYNHLKDLANTRDPNGSYIFAGFETSTLPYTHTQVAPDTDANPSTHATSAATSYAGTVAPGGIRLVEIENGRYVDANDTLDTVFQPGVAGQDLLQALDQVAIDIREDAGTLFTQSDLDTAMGVIRNAITGIEDIQRRVAGVQLEMADARKTTEALLNQDESALSSITQVDQAAAIVELQSRQTLLEAAQRSYASTSKLSLFNFL